ncbi:nuclear transport factor 2 family protein [Lutibacter sp. A80]|uniref:nuclear transport factor 2 family protein n=1 Tax=Lutibacter sp. A80 TaxID=2918453 RepID=UPI001F05A912|nr:nuclear transport factor 2 family protein [Lutibacter sp. A80]UMB60750.1 nuclear transport factor 2 family protein [Lutibacter sp. A80]
MNTKEIIEKFYTSFSNGNVEGMINCYHKDIVFKDPVFGELKGDKAVKMWLMLLSKRSETTTISFSGIKVSENKGSANWVANYVYGKDKRKVINKVSANFKFKDGKIIEHIDTFSLWLWSKQALGTVGFLLGWTPFMKNKIQKTTKKQLEDFITKS